MSQQPTTPLLFIDPPRRLGGGSTEHVIRNAAGDVIAVVTRPMRGAMFRLHRSEFPGRGLAFRTLRAAVGATEDLAREAAEDHAEQRRIDQNRYD